MAVTIIKDSERLKHTYKGSVFHYRRVPMDVRSRLMHKHSKRGDLNVGEFTRALLRWAVLGWDNVVDQEGTEVPYEVELVDALPDEVCTELADLVNESAEQDEAKAKN